MSRLLLDLVVMLGGAVGVGLPMALAIIWVCSWPFPPLTPFEPADNAIVDGNNSAGQVRVSGLATENPSSVRVRCADL